MNETTKAILTRATQSLAAVRLKVQNPPRPAPVTWQHAAERAKTR